MKDKYTSKWGKVTHLLVLQRRLSEKQEVMSSCLPADLASQLYGQLGWLSWWLAGIFSWSAVWCTGHCEGQSKWKWWRHVEWRHEVLAAPVHTATVQRSFGHLKVRNWSGPWGSNTNWSQRLVSSQVGSFMFFRTLLTILSSSFLARCSSSSVLFILLLSWRRMRERGTSGRMEGWYEIFFFFAWAKKNRDRSIKQGNSELQISFRSWLWAQQLMPSYFCWFTLFVSQVLINCSYSVSY